MKALLIIALLVPILAYSAGGIKGKGSRIQITIDLQDQARELYERGEIQKYTKVLAMPVGSRTLPCTYKVSVINNDWSCYRLVKKGSGTRWSWGSLLTEVPKYICKGTIYKN